MKEVRASVCRPKDLRVVSRYGVILDTSRATEFVGSRCGWLGMNVGSISKLPCSSVGEGNGEKGSPCALNALQTMAFSRLRLMTE